MPGRVDEDVDAGEPREHVRTHRRHSVGRADVAREEREPAAGIRTGTRRRLGQCLRAGARRAQRASPRLRT